MNKGMAGVAVGLTTAFIGFAVPAFAAASGLLFFEGDMVVSPPKGSGGASCVLSSQFMHNEEVVWRVRVLDSEGNAVTDQDLDKLQVQLSSGETFDMRYGGHPHSEPADYFWATGWRIPADYPDGSLGYTVVATKADGSTQTWQPFNVEKSQLTVVEGWVEGTE